MRALGLDVGSKTIGLAITDEAEIAAHPLAVLSRRGNVGDAAAIAALAIEHGITEIVIGIPYELSGKVGHRAKRVHELVAALQAAIGTRVTWHEQDERFTTAEAQRVLIAADVSRAKRKRVIDQQAASLILQTWLEGWQSRKRSTEQADQPPASTTAGNPE